MKSFLSGLVATALAVSVTATGLLPATAAPVVVPKVDRAELPVIDVQSREYRSTQMPSWTGGAPRSGSR